MRSILILLALLATAQEEAARSIPELIEQLRSDTVDAREAAVRELQRRGTEALPALEKATADPDAEVAGRARKAVRAIRIAERLTPALRAKIPDALPRLVNGDESVWSAILLEALREGPGPDLPEGIGRKDVEPLVEPALRGAPADRQGSGLGGATLILVNALSRHGLRGAAPELVRMLGVEGNAGLFSVIDAALVSFDATEAVPQVAAHLGNADADVRRNAAGLLGRLGDPSAVAALRSALRDPDERVRKEAVIALGALGDPGIAAELRACLKDGDFLTRAGALEQVGRRGDPAEAPHVLPLLSGGDAFLRARAARVLGRIGAKGVGAPLIERLGDEDRQVRAAAAAVLGELGERGALPRLLASLQDDLVAAKAAQALGRLGDPQAIPGLVALLRRPPDHESVRAAGEALADLGAKEGVPELLKLALEGDYGVVWSAMEALANRRALEVVPAVIAVARSKTAESTRRAHAAQLLGRLHAREAVPVLRDLLAEPAVVWAALESLGRIGADPPVAELLAAFKNPEPGIRSRAARTLLETRAAIPDLLNVLSGPDADLRIEAAGVLGGLGAREAADGLRALLRSRDSFARAIAALALAELGEREVVDQLPALLGDGDWRAVWPACRAAVLLRAAEAEPALAALIDHDGAWFRESGAEALGRLGARHRSPLLRRLLHDPSAEVRIAAIHALDDLEAYDATPGVRKRLGSEAEAMALFPPEVERQAAARFLCHAGSREGIDIVRGHFPSLLSLNALREPEAFGRWRRARCRDPLNGTVEEILRSLAKDVGVRIELPEDVAWRSERRRVEAGTGAAEALGRILDQGYGALVEPGVLKVLPRAAIRSFWRTWR